MSVFLVCLFFNKWIDHVSRVNYKGHVPFLFKNWALHITLFILQWGFVICFCYRLYHENVVFMNMHVWKCQQMFMLVINAVWNTTTYWEKSNHRLITLKIDSDAQYWKLWISHTHTQLLLQNKTNQQPESLQNYQVQYTSRWQRSTAQKHCIGCLKPFLSYTPSTVRTVSFPVVKMSPTTTCTNNLSHFLFSIWYNDVFFRCHEVIIYVKAQPQLHISFEDHQNIWCTHYISRTQFY